MLDLTLKATQAKGIFYRGYRTHIDALLNSASLEDPIPITPLVERIFALTPSIVATLTRAEVVDEGGRSVMLVENLRGRPKETFRPTINPPATGRRFEELLYSDGVLFEPPRNLNDYPETVESLRTEPFSISFETGFSRYAGSKKIIHSVHAKHSENIRDVVGSFEVSTLLRLIPAQLNCLRIGFEQYQPRWFGSMIGSGVQVHRRLFLEVTAKHLSVFAEQTSGAALDELPFGEDGLFPALDTALQEFGLFPGFSSRIQAALR